METVNERSTAFLTVTFRDKTGALAAPSLVTWEAHDKASGTELQAATALTPASSIEITISASVNRMINAASGSEVRVITIKALYGADDGINSVYEYQVRNLEHV